MAEFMSWRGRMGGRNAAPVVDHPGLGWWREARFGMFIHWGLYAIPAGIWKGEPVDGIGEWIMLRKRIPRAEYETLAKQFDPVRFDAAAWVDLAVQAGMRYLVITAKHHDGFALYQSPCCPYNIVDATPFGRDPLAELADACRAAGITLGFYYSQDQDWHDPGGSRNDWDFAAEEKDFAAYLERKVKPQLRELLTQYGPVGLIWFDTPYSISREHSIELRDFVHRLQPDCLVSGRIGNDVGDYGSLGDNQIPAGRVQADYETPATLNDTWGFKSTDHHWKSTETLLLLLIDLASKGVNYLLNVGPTADGVIPEPSAQRLRAIGAWMRTNGEAIYGTGASPFPYEHDGLRMTAKPGRLFFHLLQPAAELVVHGLRTRVTGAHLLGSAAAVRYTQDRTAAGEVDRLRLQLPDLSGCEPVPVVALDVAGDAEADPLTVQQPDGSIHLHAHLASVAKGEDSTPRGPVQRHDRRLDGHRRRAVVAGEGVRTRHLRGDRDRRTGVRHDRGERAPPAGCRRRQCGRRSAARRCRAEYAALAVLPRVRGDPRPNCGRRTGHAPLHAARHPGGYRYTGRRHRVRRHPAPGVALRSGPGIWQPHGDAVE